MRPARSGCGQSLVDLSKIDDMTDTMIRYTKRLASLQTQIDFVTEVGHKVEAFSQETKGIRPLPSVTHRDPAYERLQKFTGLARRKWPRGHIPIFPWSYVQCNILR